MTIPGEGHEGVGENEKNYCVNRFHDLKIWKLVDLKMNVSITIRYLLRHFQIFKLGNLQIT